MTAVVAARILALLHGRIGASRAARRRAPVELDGLATRRSSAPRVTRIAASSPPPNVSTTSRSSQLDEPRTDQGKVAKSGSLLSTSSE